MEPTTAPALDPSASSVGLSPARGESQISLAPQRRPRAASRLRRLRMAAGLVLLFAVSAGFTYLGTWPPMATVMSGSMEPTIDTGDVVLFKRLKAPPRMGDIVAVRVPDSARRRYGYPEEVVHRVVAISPKGALSTKGDGREKPDPFTVPSSVVKAKVAFTIPAAGRVFAFLTSTLGLAWMAAGVFILLVLPRFERQRELQEVEQQTMAELRAELARVSTDLSRLRESDDRAPGTIDHRLDMLVREAQEARELLLELIEDREHDAGAPHDEPAPDAVDPASTADTVESPALDPVLLDEPPEYAPHGAPGSSQAIEFGRIFAPVLAEPVEFELAEIEPEPMRAAAPDDPSPPREDAEPEVVITTTVVRRRTGGLIGTGLARARRRAGGE
jgi:signal peptidase I